MPPTIMFISRAPIDPAQCKLGSIDLTSLLGVDYQDPLANLNVAERVLYRLKDWLDLQEWSQGGGPAVLGVLPEQRIYLYVYNSSNAVNWDVFSVVKDLTTKDEYAYELDVTNVTTLHFSLDLVLAGLGLCALDLPIEQISVVLPDMAVLEGLHQHERNGLVMGMRTKVANELKEESPCWLPFPLWLPPPYRGTHFHWEPKGNRVDVGYLDLPYPPPKPEERSDYMGRQAIRDTEAEVDAPNGQVRWYSLDEYPQFEFLKSQQPAANVSQPDDLWALPLPEFVASKLAAVRRAGRWLYNEVIHWDDNCVQFTTPDEPGVAVIWRDDLPSQPIGCFDPLAYALDLARQLWQPLSNLVPEEVDISIPIPVGQLIELGVGRLQDAINNKLAEFIGNGLTVQFAFLAQPYQEAGHENDPNTFDLAKLMDRTLGCIGMRPDNLEQAAQEPVFRAFFESEEALRDTGLSFRYSPQVSHSLAESRTDDFTLQLTIIINGTVKLLGYDITFPENTILEIGPRFKFHPQPVVLPTMAIFFENEGFTGSALVMLPLGTELFGGSAVHVDAYTPGDLNNKRMAIIDNLSTAKDLISILNDYFWHNQTVDLITGVVSELLAKAASVIDSTMYIRDVGDCVIEQKWWVLPDNTFNDKISSVVLIGPPHHWTGLVVKCWEHPLSERDRGDHVTLQLPDDCFIAAIPRFSALLNNYAIPNTGIQVQLPYGPSGWPHLKDNNFDNKVTGLQMMTEW